MANDEAESVSMQHSTIRKTNAILIDEKDQAWRNKQSVETRKHTTDFCQTYQTNKTKNDKNVWRDFPFLGPCAIQINLRVLSTFLISCSLAATSVQVFEGLKLNVSG